MAYSAKEFKVLFDLYEYTDDELIYSEKTTISDTKSLYNGYSYKVTVSDSPFCKKINSILKSEITEIESINYIITNKKLHI